MARYILECPQCLARFNLRRHVPGRRFRCRKCRTVIIIPEAPAQVQVPAGAERKPLSPELRAKVVNALALRRLALLATILTAVLAGATVAVVVKSERRFKPEPPPETRLTLDKLAELNRLLALPLARGARWEYALAGGGTEERRVALLSRGLDDEPLADVGITGSLDAGRQTLRATREGISLVSEVRGDATYSYSPPLRVVPHPLYLGDAWKYQGSRVRDGGAAEEWALEYRVADRPEAVDSGVGRQTCFRVEVKGSRGPRKVEETLWYAKGVGLVKRLTRVDGRTEEALLMKMSRE